MKLKARSLHSSKDLPMIVLLRSSGATEQRIGPGSTSIIEGNAQAYDFFKNGADIPRPTMRNSFVLVQWHGESSVRETSLMI